MSWIDVCKNCIFIFERYTSSVLRWHAVDVRGLWKRCWENWVVRAIILILNSRNRFHADCRQNIFLWPLLSYLSFVGDFMIDKILIQLNRINKKILQNSTWMTEKKMLLLFSTLIYSWFVFFSFSLHR